MNLDKVPGKGNEKDTKTEPILRGTDTATQETDTQNTPATTTTTAGSRPLRSRLDQFVRSRRQSPPPPPVSVRVGTSGAPPAQEDSDTIADVEVRALHMHLTHRAHAHACVSACRHYWGTCSC